jgi:predicted RNA-binding protein Jag
VKRPRIDSKTLKLYNDRPKEDRMKKDNKKSPRRDNKDTTKDKKIEKREPKEIKVYERFFETSSYSFDEAKAKALTYFAINEESILEHEVVSKGKKKFFFFGAQLTNYKFKVKPIYRKILLPFLINIFKKMGLRVYVNVTFRNPNVSVTFTGKDAGLLLKNKFELHNAVKELSLNYLRNKVSMSSNTKVTFRTEADDRPNNNKNDKRPERKKYDRPRQNNSKSESELHKMADSAKQEVLDKSSSILMKKLNPAERRIIHQYIEADPKFKSSSVGDGRFKQIKISPVS